MHDTRWPDLSQVGILGSKNLEEFYNLDANTQHKTPRDIGSIFIFSGNQLGHRIFNEHYSPLNYHNCRVGAF